MTTRARPGAWILSFTLALGLASCSSDVSAPPDGRRPERQQVDWKRVHYEGTIRSIVGIGSIEPGPHLTAAGVRDGKPLVGYLADGKLTEIPFRNHHASAGGLRAMTDDGMNYAVSDVNDPRSGEPARMWVGTSAPPDPSVISPTTQFETLRSVSGRPAVWLDPLFTSEDFGVVGVVRENAGWQVHGWYIDAKVAQLDKGRPLYVRGTPSSARLLTGITESSLIAAGALTDAEPATKRTPQVWTLDGYDPGERMQWSRHRLDPVPDRLTAISTWESGWLLAGERDLAPVVYDFDEGDGEAIDMPSTRLDPAHPGVFVALNVGSSPILGTQSVDGPRVWFKADGRWRALKAPAGRLQAVEFDGQELYLLVDGSIWHTEAPAELLHTRP